MLTRSDPGAKHGRAHQLGRMRTHFYHLEIIIDNKRTVSNVFRRLVRRESPLLCLSVLWIEHVEDATHASRRNTHTA